jgi:hypothetical protein
MTFLAAPVPAGVVHVRAVDDTQDVLRHLVGPMKAFRTESGPPKASPYRVRAIASVGGMLDGDTAETTGESNEKRTSAFSLE